MNIVLELRILLVRKLFWTRSQLGFMEGFEVYRIRPPKYVLRSDLGILDELMSSIEEESCLNL